MLLYFTKSSSSEASMDINVGLRLLPQIITNSSSSKSKSNILLKSEMRRKRNQTNPQDSCYLKTCNLCNKKLKPDKDIYMYRYIHINYCRPTSLIQLHTHFRKQMYKINFLSLLGRNSHGYC